MNISCFYYWSEKVNPYSFPKSHRLLNRSEFLSLAGTGRRVQNSHFIAVFRPASSGRLRIGITVTKRVGNAVTRNRLKRLTREFFRNTCNELSFLCDINIIIKKEAVILSSDQFFSSLHHLFDKIARKIEN